jgi:hypothetical protein
MPQAVPLYGFHRIWRWSAIGAALALLAYSASIIAGIAPLAAWEGHGIYSNIGRFCGAAIGGAFLGALLALSRDAQRPR